jgi:hypothetical protein
MREVSVKRLQDGKRVSPLFDLALVLVCLDHSACAVYQSRPNGSVGNEINAAFIFARADFVKVGDHKTALIISLKT